MFWILCTLLTLVVVSYLALPLLRPEAANDASPDVEIYKDQLSEVDRDIARGLLNADEGDRARTEISRRLLAAARATQASGAAPMRANRLAVTATLLLVAGIGAVTYAQIGAPGVPDQPLVDRLELADEMRQSRPGQTALRGSSTGRLTLVGRVLFGSDMGVCSFWMRLHPKRAIGPGCSPATIPMAEPRASMRHTRSDGFVDELPAPEAMHRKGFGQR